MNNFEQKSEFPTLPHSAGGQVDQVHVGQLVIQLLQQLKHVEAGREIFLKSKVRKRVFGLCQIQKVLVFKKIFPVDEMLT